MIGLPKKIFLPDVCFAMPRFSLCHRYLNAFLVCAHEKSFSKAARLLYVSPTALIKQIEQLEEGIGTTLFERTPRGLVLTRSGSVLQSKAQNFVQHGDALLTDVRTSADSRDINVGTSDVFSGRYVIELWYRLQKRLSTSASRIRLISYANDRRRADQILTGLGSEIDVIAGVFDDRFLSHYDCSGLVLERVPIGCCVAATHPLAGKTSVTVDELLSYELFVLERDLLEDFDAARDALDAKTPVPREVEFNFLDLEVFNRAQASESVILNIPYWTEAHSLFRWIPIEWPLTARFGLIYSKTPSAGLQDFIDEAAKETRT